MPRMDGQFNNNRLYAASVLARGFSSSGFIRTKGVSKTFYRTLQRSPLKPDRSYWTEIPHRIEESNGEDLPGWLILWDMYSGPIRLEPGDSDRVEMARLTRFALEQAFSGFITQWSNPDSGRKGTITVFPHYWTEAGSFCSDLQQTLNYKDITDLAYGTACLGFDGKWRIKR